MQAASARIIITFFNKLKPIDFQKDAFLRGFYNAYLTERDGTSAIPPDLKSGKPEVPAYEGNPKLTVFEYYMEYIMRNKEYKVTDNQKEIYQLCDDIKQAIFTTDCHKCRRCQKCLQYERCSQCKKDERCSRCLVCSKCNDCTLCNANITPKAPIITTRGNKKSVSLDKDFAIQILSEFINLSSIVVDETPDNDQTQYDDDFRNATTATIISELQESGQIIPAAKKDVGFNHRNEMLEIWHDTEQKCIEFINNDALANVLKKVYFINGLDAKNRSLTTLECKDVSAIESGSSSKLLVVPGHRRNMPVAAKLKYADDEALVVFRGTFLPIETLSHRASRAKYRTVVNVLNASPLSETMIRNKRNIPTAYVCTGSQIIPGGNADQGIKTNESVVYYSSSYHLCLEQAKMAYPLTTSQILVMPNILVFKDHSKHKYPMLPPANGQKISIIMSPGVYRPSTNLKNQDKYMVDSRLYNPNARYSNTKQITDRFHAIFETALFFGYDTVVLDDQGIEDFWLPLHNTASILGSVIKTYNGKFKEIVVAIEKTHLYTTYKKYIT
jgi:hypothetical protein